ncbi:MAG: AraC family transcriptional regulator, partial [Pseudomonadota bacterium]
EHLPRDVPSSAAVASILGLSGRTLARRLADEGASYQAIVDGVRRRLAESYLDDTALSLAEIAW